MNGKRSKEIRQVAKIAGARMEELAYLPTKRGQPIKVAPNTQRGIVKAAKKAAKKK